MSRRALLLVTLAVLPMRTADASQASKGTLILDGGGATPLVLKHFVSRAGGREAPIVIVPTGATSIRLDRKTWLDLGSPRDAKEWRTYETLTRKWLDATNLTVLHPRDRDEANREDFVAPLRSAQGAYLGPGNTGRLANTFLGTLALAEMRALLARGGVLLGSSAGAMIQGSFILRGRPDKPLLMAPGRTAGFAFLENVAINSHLTAARRDDELVNVIDANPHLLGIGIDDDAAIVVDLAPQTFEVIGTGRVAIYDNVLRPTGNWYYLLTAGARFDLVARRELTATAR